MKFYSIDDFVRWNEDQTCSAEGCNKKRRRMNKYCHLHMQRVYFSGDPNTTPVIRFKYYKAETKVAKEVLERNLTDHEGLRDVLTYIQGRMRAAGRGDKIDNPRLWQALDMLDASPLDILSQIGGIYALYVFRSPMIKTSKHLTFMTGKAAVKDVSFKMLGAQPNFRVRALGRELQSKFSPLFINLGQATLELIEDRQERREALKQAFNLANNGLPSHLKDPKP